MKVYRPKRKQVYIPVPNMKKQPKTSVIASQDTVLEVCEPVISNCDSLCLDELNSMISQKITGNTEETQQNHPPDTKKQLCVIGSVFACAVVLTLINADIRLQLAFYLLSVTAAIAYDPLQLFNLVLARGSRWIMAGLLFMASIGCYFFSSNGRYWLVWFSTSALGVVLVFLLNHRLMQAEKYKMTAAVEQTIVNTSESQAYQYYLVRGKDECRTLALRQNLQFNEYILDSLFGMFYRLGFASGWRKTEQAAVTIEKLSDAVERAEETARIAEEELVRVTRERDLILKECDELKGIVDGSRFTKELYQKKYEDISAENDRLHQANEELVSLIGEEASAEDVTNLAEVTAVIRESAEEKARALLKRGYSIRQTVTLSGVSFANVRKIRKDLIESGEIATDEKIVSIKSATA